MMHFVLLRPLPINGVGNVIDKNSGASIGELMGASTQIRVVQDTGVPNSYGYPLINEYLELEARTGFYLGTINQTFIVTYSN